MVDKSKLSTRYRKICDNLPIRHDAKSIRFVGNTLDALPQMQAQRPCLVPRAQAKPAGMKWECGIGGLNTAPQATTAPATVSGEHDPDTTGHLAGKVGHAATRESGDQPDNGASAPTKQADGVCRGGERMRQALSAHLTPQRNICWGDL